MLGTPNSGCARSSILRPRWLLRICGRSATAFQFLTWLGLLWSITLWSGRMCCLYDL
jgi:hypothetical protein